MSDFQEPPPPCPSTSKVLPPPWAWTSNFKRTPLNFKRKPHYLLFRGFILLCVQLSKNITKSFLFIITHIFSAHFAICILLFYLHNLKTNYGKATTPCMWMSKIKTKTKPSHVTFKLTTCSIVWLSPLTMQQYH